MKVDEIFEANFSNQMRSWERKNEYPSHWDDPEFEPEENGYMSFEEAWGEINKAVRANSGAALVRLAKEQGSSPQKEYQEIKRTMKYALDDNGGNAEGLLYKEDIVQKVVNVIQQAGSGEAQSKRFWQIMNNMAEPAVYDNVADDFDNQRGDFEADVDEDDIRGRGRY